MNINFFVNWIFNFRSPIQTFHLDEYLIAILLAFVILEISRKINSLIQSKIRGNTTLFKEILICLLADIFFVLFLINVMGTGYMFLIYGDTYTVEEYTVINLIAITFTSIFILADFLFNSRKESSPEKLDPIPATSGTLKKWIQPDDIHACFVENSVTFVVTSEGKFLTDLTLNELASWLSENSFYRANRQHILNKTIIDSTKSSEYGKLEVFLKASSNLPTSVIVSRKQASSFRKWLKKS